MQKILVIKHNDIGEFIHSIGAFSAIRKKHSKASITLLTTKKLAELAALTGFFDKIWVDDIPEFWNISAIISMSKKLSGQKFDMIYDLERSFRSNMYFRIMGRKKPNWSGAIGWCSHPYIPPRRKYMHIVDRNFNQLAAAGIKRVPESDISWLTGDISKFKLPQNFVIIAPGLVKGGEKESDSFAELAEWFAKEGVTPVFIGSRGEKYAVESVIDKCKGAKVINLAGKAGFAEVAEMARGAIVAVGGDSDMMYVAAATYCPTVMILPSNSKSYYKIPFGEYVEIISKQDMQDLDLEEVTDAIDAVLPPETLDSTEKQPKTQQS